MTQTPAVAVEAWAKVNLYLHVVGRRTDGYHLLDSLMAFAGVGDTITVRPADDLNLTIEGPFAGDVPAGDDNLVLRAAKMLALEAGRPARAAIRLVKRLPAASGIGGGSADAAATLGALVNLWAVDMPEPDLAALGLRLGADVPICLRGRPAFVGGIGEAMADAPPLPAAWFVLANPGVAVPTPAVFRAREGAFSQAARFADPPADAAALARILDARRNDLSPPAQAIAPVIREVLAELAALPGALMARMSGSGATCFALFGDEAAARRGTRTMTLARPEWWVVAAPLRA